MFISERLTIKGNKEKTFNNRKKNEFDENNQQKNNESDVNLNFKIFLREPGGKILNN